VSGLPASGKTTIARRLAQALGLPLYDKDVILEALFDTLGCVDPAARQRLSRASDRVLMTLVQQSSGAVIASFWRHPGDEGNAGTPCEWLEQLSPSLVEVHCHCPPEIAAQRFLRRSRHPGHHDSARSEQMLLTQFHATARRGCLGLGSLVVVDTSGQQDTELPIEQISRALQKC
jgi:shikimate kinase